MFKMLLIYAVMAWGLTSMQSCGTGNTYNNTTNLTDLFDMAGNFLFGSDGNTLTADQKIAQTSTAKFTQEFSQQRSEGLAEAQKTVSKLDALIPRLPGGAGERGPIEGEVNTAQALWDNINSPEKTAFLKANKPMRDPRLAPTLKLTALMTWTLSPQKYRYYNGVRTKKEQNEKYPKFSKCREDLNSSKIKCPHVRRHASDFFVCKKNNCKKAEWNTARCAYVLGFADFYAKWLSNHRLNKKICKQREIITWDACHDEDKSGKYCL